MTVQKNEKKPKMRENTKLECRKRKTEIRDCKRNHREVENGRVLQIIYTHAREIRAKVEGGILREYSGDKHAEIRT